MSEANTEQEIVEELKRRFPPPHFKDWRVRENWGGSHMAECSVGGVEERFCERVVVATAATHEKLLAAIRSLPVPSEPSGEHVAGGEGMAIPSGQERYALAPNGSWHWVDSETDIPWDGKSYLARASLRTVEEFPSLGTRPLPKFIIDVEGLEPDPQHIAAAYLLADAPLLAKQVATLRTALRKLAEVTERMKKQVRHFSGCPGYYEIDKCNCGKDAVLAEFADWLSSHRSLLDGAPKKEEA